MTSNVNEEVHITMEYDGDTNNLYEPFLVIATRNAQGPILTGILCGGNDKNISYLRGVKILPLAKTGFITIIDSTENTPLILKSSFGVVLYTFIKMNNNPKLKLNVEIVK